MFVLHGILANGRSWRSFARRLADRRPDLRLVLVDHRGHGDSRGAPPPHDLAACAADLGRLAETRTPSAVIGHSFGGKVALAFARTRSAPLATWVIDSPAGTSGNTDEVDRVLEVVRALPASLESRSVAAAALARAGVAPAVVAWMETNLEREDSGAPGGPAHFRWRFDVDVVSALMASYRALDLWGVVREAPGVTLVRGAKSDRWSPGELAAFEALPPEKRITLDAGHWVQIDAADALLELLAARLPVGEAEL